MRSRVLVFLLAIPLALAWVYPHQSSYSVNPFERIRLCATVYAESNSSVSLVCDNEVVGEQNVVANVPMIVCYHYTPRDTTTCTWVQGSNQASVRIEVFPHVLFDAVLAVLLVVLIVRFAVRLLKIFV